MHSVLRHQELYEYIGDGPSSLADLKEKYQRLESQISPDGSEAWLNWILRRRETREPIGTLQAGISGQTAALAWMIGVHWQRQGFASEAALRVVDWLLCKGIDNFTANIHPENIASQVVSRRLGLARSADVVDGEDVWRMVAAGSYIRRKVPQPGRL